MNSAPFLAGGGMITDDGMTSVLPRLYVRDLPGGGYVAIDLVSDADPIAGAPCRARIAVERRAGPERRSGHHPPIIAEAEGESRSEVFGDLYRIACDNVAVARGLLHWRRQRLSSPVEAVTA
jgi:hypothetical protein